MIAVSSYYGETSFRPSPAFFRKIELICTNGERASGRNLPVLNSGYALVNGKRPKSLPISKYREAFETFISSLFIFFRYRYQAS